MNPGVFEKGVPLRVLLLANTDWYLYNFRRSLAWTLRDSGYQVLLVSPPGPYGAKLVDEGFRWIPSPMQRRSLNPLRELRFLLWLRRLLLDERIDLVHGFTIKCAVYGALAARFSDVRARVCSVAGMGYVYSSADVKASLLRPFVTGLLKLALTGGQTRLIVQNPEDLEFFEKMRLASSNQIRLIPGSGVDCKRFSPSVRSKSSDEPLRILLPARLLWDKGIAEYVEASRLIRQRGRHIVFLLAGQPDEGNPAAVSAKQVTAWNGEGLVQWLGHVDDMAELLKSVDVVVLPSYREGLPKGLIEACASGLPIITTDVPGCRDVVANGENGWLVPVRNPMALAQAIVNLDDDAGLRARMGMRARQRAEAEFEDGIILKQTLEVYDELLRTRADG